MALALAVALVASAWYGGVFVTVSSAQILGAPPPVEEVVDLAPVETPVPTPTAPLAEDPTSVQGPLPSAGAESPVNRRDSINHSAVRRAARVGVPNDSIDKFRLPPFLLPIYQAAGMQYGVRWEILAAINEIETEYGRNLNVSSAGALGWMQFLPSTWRVYGVDASGDGVQDPYDPVDAIFAAARYLNAAGAETDIRRAVFAYNHANWYVDSVLMRAQVIGGLPSDLVGSLTGLTQGRPAPKVRRRDERADRDLDTGAAAETIAGLPLKQRLFANPTRPAVRAVLERSVRIADQSDARRIAPSSSGPASRGDTTSSRCCLSAPSTSASTSPTS